MKSIILILITLFCFGCSKTIPLGGIEDAIFIYQPVSKDFISKAKLLISSCTSKIKIKKIPKPNFIVINFVIDGKKMYIFTIDKNNLPFKKIIIYERNRDGCFLLDNYTAGYEEVISLMLKGIPNDF